MAKSKRTPIELTDEERARLKSIRDDGKSQRKHAWRADIILHIASGSSVAETVREVGKSKPTVERWWDRFLEERVDGLLRDKTRSPGRPPTPVDEVKALIDLAMSPPPPNASHWTLRALAEKMNGMVFSTVRNILKTYGLAPHKVKTFKVSRDPAFEEKIHDVVGLYINPPDHAVVLSIDEKTQIQALGRTQKPLPMTPGHAATRTHDYKRNGTTCLIAALDIATGKVTGQMTPRHRSSDFLAFLDQIDDGIETETEIHVILDNVSSHKSALVHEWLKEHPRWRFHFTPTSASWTNAIEGFFSKLARQRLKNAVFNSLDDCIEAIESFLQHHNETQARPFKWSRKPEDLVASWKRGYQMLEANQ